MASSFSISGNIFLFSLIIIIFSGFIIPMLTTKKPYRYCVILIMIYFLNYILIGLYTADHACLDNKTNHSYILIHSIWPALMSLALLGLFLAVPSVASFFIKPFKNLLDNDDPNSLLGETVGEGVNLVGICLSGQLITYYNVLNNSCVP